MAGMRVWTEHVDKSACHRSCRGKLRMDLVDRIGASGTLWDIMSLYIEGSERSLRANGLWPSAFPFCTPGPMSLTKMPACCMASTRDGFQILYKSNRAIILITMCDPLFIEIFRIVNLVPSPSHRNIRSSAVRSIRTSLYLLTL